MSGIPTNSADIHPWQTTPIRTDAAVFPLARLRRWLFLILVLGTTGLGAGTLFVIVRADGVTTLQMLGLFLFTLLFCWIAMAFWTAVVGFVLVLLKRDPLFLGRVPTSGPAQPVANGLTVLAMPVFNEDPQRVVAGLEATCLSLVDTGQAHRFEVFVLSDSDDPDIIAAEEPAVAWLQRRLNGRIQVHYRRRNDNQGRKAGNLAEFCRNWGARYRYMVVLDADSVMEGETLLRMTAIMDRNPRLGLLQTIPLPVRQTTAFGRFLQFASALYSPMLGAGQAFWQMDAANYWGHNAILRVQPFMQCCGLPTLPGRPPLGGEILSHDFVEAALLRRAGWQVWLDASLTGSYEEIPGNLLDYAKRDRRWTQGNLQHLRLLFSPRLHLLSRLHFTLGAFAYLSSVIWLALLAVATVDAMLATRGETAFFGLTYQLYPSWPVVHPELILALLLTTGALLLLPRLLGVLLALLRQRRAFGGARALLTGALMETLFSILVAPLMMVYHTQFVLGILTGFSVSWGPQAREGRTVRWAEAWKRTAVAYGFGLVWGAVTLWLAPGFLVWLLLIWVGLFCAAPIVRWSSSLALGRRLRAWGLLLAPSETMSRGTVLSRLHSERDPALPSRSLMEPPPRTAGVMSLQTL